MSSSKSFERRKGSGVCVDCVATMWRCQTLKYGENSACSMLGDINTIRCTLNPDQLSFSILRAGSLRQHNPACFSGAWQASSPLSSCQTWPDAHCAPFRPGR